MTVFLFLFFLFAQHISAGHTGVSDDYLIRNFTTENGLPVNAINDIVQDEDGYLYFATLNGLARYDGYKFTTFNSSNSAGIVSDRFTGMLQMENGNIWLPTESASLTLFRNNTFKTFGEEHGVTGHTLILKEGHEGNLWVASSAGVQTFHTETEQFSGFPNSLLQVPAQSLGLANDGGMLIVNEHGLVHFDGDQAKIILSHDEFPVHMNNIMNIMQTGDGTIWVIGMDFFAFNPNSGIIYNFDFQDFENPIVWNVYESGSDIIISASEGFFRADVENQALHKLPINVNPMINRPNTAAFFKNNTVLFGDQTVLNGRPIFETDMVKTGFVDREGSIWIASVTNGLFQLSPSIIKNIHLRDQYTIENVYPVVESADGAIWAGSLLTGVYRLEGNETDFWNSSNSSLTTDQVRFLYQDNDQTLYLGLWADGLWKFTGSDWTRIEEFDRLIDYPASTVEAMLRDESGALFIGTRGITIVEKDGHYQPLQDYLQSGRDLDIEGVRVIRKEPETPIFFGTNGNGLHLLSADGTVSTIDESHGLPSNFIRDIFIQAKDTLWIASENRGLARITLNEEYEPVTIASIDARHGLLDNALHKIIQDPLQNFWISSNSGVMRIPLHMLNAFADGHLANLLVIGYNQQDGMINHEANGGVQTAGLLSSHGQIWFPNQKGLTIFNLYEAGSVLESGIVKPIIEEVILANTTIQIRENTSVTLPKGNRNFSISFTAPNFAYPDRVNFTYRIPEINNDWIPENQTRQAIYTNIPPGVHHFEVQVETSGGEIAKTLLTITVPPYFYETAWFTFLMVLGGLCMIYMGIKYRTRTLKVREKNLQQRVAEQTRALKEADEQKSRFFSGITHELKTPLSLIYSPLEDIIESGKPDSWPQIEKKLHLMQRNTYRLKNLVDQMLQVTRINAESVKLTFQPGNFERLTRQVIGQFQSRLDQKKMTVVFHTTPIDAPVYLDYEAWERIIINLMSNAIKFSPEKSDIHIDIKNLENNVCFRIKDHGKGIEPDELDKIFDYLYQAKDARSFEGTGIGLYLVKELTEKMGGKIEVTSQKNKGTQFVIYLKKGFSHVGEPNHVVHKPFRGSHNIIKKTPAAASLPEQGTPDKEKILIVEDNYDFRTYLTSILSKKYKVITAAEGAEALALLESTLPDLIVSDIMMPGTNGLELVNTIRKKKKLKYLPVIFLSAKDQESDKEEGLSTGADIYLTKPIRSRMLLAQIEAVLRREKILRQTRPVGDNHQKNKESTLVKQVREIVYRQLAEPSLNVNLIAEALYMSRTRLYGEWKKASDISLNDFIKKLRLREGKALIIEKGFSVQEAAQAVGYTNLGYFSTTFKKEFGKSPSEFMD